MMQLEFNIFEKTETEKIYCEIFSLSKSQTSLRKGIFHRHSTLSKNIDNLQSEIDNLKHQVLILEGFIKKHIQISEKNI
jgi:hypothetical protein